MGVSLTKGGNVNLTRTTPGLQRITVGLGWDARASAGEDFDLDAARTQGYGYARLQRLALEHLLGVR